MKYETNGSQLAMKWDLCNKIINAVRKRKGIAIRPQGENPYKQSKRTVDYTYGQSVYTVFEGLDEDESGKDIEKWMVEKDRFIGYNSKKHMIAVDIGSSKDGELFVVEYYANDIFGDRKSAQKEADKRNKIISKMRECVV